MVRVRFYGKLGAGIGPEVEFDAPAGCSVAELRLELASDHPQVAEALLNGSSRAFIGNAFVPEDCRIGADDWVEFLPPVSGG